VANITSKSDIERAYPLKVNQSTFKMLKEYSLSYADIVLFQQTVNVYQVPLILSSNTHLEGASAFISYF